MKSKDIKGVLYVIATPIGNLSDLSFRAASILSKVDCVLCEDTRTSSILLQHYRIHAPKMSLHKHNEARRCDYLVGRLKKGQRLALISDAGTPLFSDAGHLLVTACHRERIPVVPIPGANAVAAALSCAGFCGSRFVFDGFLPPRRSARLKRLHYLKREERTLIFFEAPHRIAAAMRDLITVFGAERSACLLKELTKMHEQIVRGSLSDIESWLSTSAQQSQGEFVILLEACKAEPSEEITIYAKDLADILSEHLPPGKAAALVATVSGVARRRVYRKEARAKNCKAQNENSTD